MSNTPPPSMRHIAAALLFDRDGKLLIYLRDDKPTIPFPNHWDFFGGHVEAGETPEQALVREVREEIGIGLTRFTKFRDYVCTEGDAYPNTKHIYYATLPVRPAELTLHEGQRLTSIDLADRAKYRWANILGRIVEDFVASGITPQKA